MNKRALTPAEQEEERKRQADAWWNKVIVYYLNQMYHEQVDREVDKFAPKPLLLDLVNERMGEQSLLELLLRKEPGKLSPVEMLERMNKYQEANSPFRQLLTALKEPTPDQEKIARTMSICVEEAPKQILEREQKHKSIQQQQKEEQPDPQEAERVRQHEERLKYEMTFLRAVMPAQLFAQLCQGLKEQGREIDPEKDFQFLPEREEAAGPTYEEYVAQHRVLPREKDGRLENMDELITAAAYTLAAYEQKDDTAFNEKAADARAMELAGSRAFRSYIKDHPGSLLAAAQNTGLEATYHGMMAAEGKMAARDKTLTAVRDALRSKATGRSAAYHQMTNALDRFLTAKEEPSRQEKNALAMKLAQFVMTEGSPNHPGYKRESTLQASRALQALLPKGEFESFLATANAGRAPEEQIKPEALEALAAEPRQQAPEQAAPVLERRNEWN